MNLRPCPFCGGSATLTKAELHGHIGGTVTCGGCGVWIWRDSEAEVRQTWDSRADRVTDSRGKRCPKCNSTSYSYNLSVKPGAGAFRCDDCKHRWDAAA